MTESEQIVYISCIKEVRYSFVSHLCQALRRKGIHDVFVDSEDLLSSESQSKLERARVFVMVLPCRNKVNFEKLYKVLECQKNNKDQVVVVPVLYDEDLLHKEWDTFLYRAGLSAVHQSRHECTDSELVEEITRDVYDKLFYMELVGIYSKRLEIENMVNKQPIGIRCVGIWGMPGIGKTTLAKAVFDQMSGDFDAYCFINDYDKSIHEKGLYRLLEEHFLKEKPGAGSTITKLSLLSNKFNNKKRVLVVLDDVRNPLMAEPLLGGFDWFGPESLIIITSRDKQVFRLCRVNQIYEVQGLNEKEALQLFSLSASIKNDREPNLHKLSMKVIEYANGNPLALSIYGRELKGKKNLSEMETTFLNLKGHPPIKIFDAFKSSYDSLNDRERNIFLDIACFIQGENVDYVMQLLGGCGFLPHVGIDVLVEKCLVTISENRVWMHNLIQVVGQEIINTETEQIERRSRLWEPGSIKYLLEDNKDIGNVEEPRTTSKHAKGTEEIEGMFLDTSNLSFNIKPVAFDNMLNLRLLKIYCSNPEIHPVINFSCGSLRYLSNELRLLHWENYPLQFLPENFDPMHLVEINMPYSQLQTLWGGTKNLKMLRTIRLCHSQKLVEVGDLSKAQDLEVIDLQGCTRLQSFPATDKLLHLRVVNLSGCREIKEFPEIRPNIEALHLQGTGIRKLIIFKPNGREVVSLSELVGLSNALKLELLARLEKSRSSSQELAKLICLELKDCTCLQSLPNMVNLELLKVLDLSGCSELKTIKGFPRNLKELYIAGTAVRKVPQFPQSLELFNAHGCVSLKSIHLDSEKLPMHYTFSNCFDLYISPQVINDFLVKALANAEHIPRERQQELNKSPAFSFCAPSHVNQYFTLDLQPGYSVMTWLNPSWRNTLVGFAMLVEVTFSKDYCDATGFGISCVCRWSNKEGCSRRIERNLHCWALGKAVQKDHMFVFCDVNMRPSNDEGNDPDIWADLVVFEFFPVDKQTKPLSDSCTVRRCGVRVVTDANCNTSIENILPVWSLDPMEDSGNEGKEALRISYDGLQEIDKALFLYIVGLFNDEDGGLVAPHIANIIDMDVSNGLKVLADRSLIRVSSNGEIVMPSFLRQMGKEILLTEPMQRLVENCQSSMMNARKIEITHSENPENWTRDSSYVTTKPTPTGPQVFINFRGKDVRNGFISFLEPAMREANINVFIDKDEVVGTDLVNLFVRIQESRVAVVLFSKDYTSSEWCLDELAQIKDCTDQGGLSVIPIFYKLATANVKELKGDFGDTFRALKRTYKDEPQRTQKWEEALESISNIKGMTLSEQSDMNEGEFMNEMIFEIQRLLSQIARKGNPKVESNSEGGFLVPARILDITHSDNPEKWTWSAIYDRPHKADIEIATMINTHALIKVTGDFHTRKLIPGKKYEVVFLVRLDDTSLGWKKKVTLMLRLTMGDGTFNEQEKALYLDEYIEENWVDIHVGQFEAPPKKENAKIFFSMYQYVDTDRKSGLVVKGFAIRPAAE